MPRRATRCYDTIHAYARKRRAMRSGAPLHRDEITTRPSAQPHDDTAMARLCACYPRRRERAAREPRRRAQRAASDAMFYAIVLKIVFDIRCAQRQTPP